MPYSDEAYLDSKGIIFLKLRQNPVDMKEGSGIISLTTSGHNLKGACNVKSTTFRPEAGGTARTRHGQPPPGGCQRQSFSRKRVFRPTRSRAGKIRDAAPPSNGRGAGNLRSPDFRLFTGYLLPGSKAVQRGWNWRAPPEAQRPKACSQTLRGVGWLYRDGPGFGSNSSLTGSCGNDQNSLRYLGTPAQHRAGACATAKKTPRLAARASSPCHAELTERYEQLRNQVLSQLSGGAATGLLVNRGMAVWMRVWGSGDPAPERSSANTPAPNRPCTGIQSDLVMIMAGMALSWKKGHEDDGSNAFQSKSYAS